MNKLNNIIERGGPRTIDQRSRIAAASLAAALAAGLCIAVGAAISGDPGVEREPTGEEQSLCELDLAKLGADPQAKFLETERSVGADGVEKVRVQLSDGSLLSVKINPDGEFSKIVFTDSGGDEHPVDSEAIGC